jgi:hypothetical protein
MGYDAVPSATKGEAMTDTVRPWTAHIDHTRPADPVSRVELTDFIAWTMSCEIALRDGTDEAVWRHEAEYGDMVLVLKAARCRAEALRIQQDDGTWQHPLRMIRRSLPLARIKELVGDEVPEQEAA